MATFLSTAAIGNREDLTDIIYRISPTQTPVLNLASKTKATATTHEWQTQDLAAASGSNEAAEGADASDKTVTPTVRLTNRTQISTKAVYVSGTQMSGVNPAGRKDELGYQVSLASLELKRDMETALCQNDLSVGGATRRSRGLRGWVVDNVNRNGGTLASYTASGGLGSGYTAGTQRAFVESQVKDVLQQIFTAGGMPDTIMLPPAAKQTFSGFTGNATRMDKSEDSKLYAAVDFYVSDFGTIEAVPNRFMALRDVFILQSDKLAVAYMRPFQTKELAATGDAEKRELIVEWTLECRAPKAHGAVYDIL